MYRIEARNLTKTFKTHKSRPGLLGALRDLFTRQYTTITAVDGINLLVEEGRWSATSAPTEPANRRRSRC